MIDLHSHPDGRLPLVEDSAECLDGCLLEQGDEAWRAEDVNVAGAKCGRSVGRGDDQARLPFESDCHVHEPPR